MRTTIFMLLTLTTLSSAAMAAPADAVYNERHVKEGADKQVLLVNDEEPGFIEKYFPFSLKVENPSVDDKLVGLWIGVLLPFGFIWSPYVFGDERPGDDFIIDAIIIVLLHLAPFLIYFVLFPIVLIPFLGLALLALVGLLEFIYLWINLFYLMPVAIINAYDRSLGFESERKKPRRKRKNRKNRRRRRSSELELPGMPALAQPLTATVAY